MPLYLFKKLTIVIFSFLFVVTPLRSDPMISEYTVAGLPVSGVNQQLLYDVQAAVDALNTGQWVIANNVFTHITETMPKSPIGWIGQSITAQTMEQKTAALGSASKLKSVATAAEKLLIQIETASIEGNVNKALELSKKLTENYPKSSWAWIKYGYSLQDNRQVIESRKAFKTAAIVSKYPISALLASGNSYIFSEPKDLIQAEDFLKQAVQIRPTSAWIQINLGDVHRAQQDLNMARNDYGRASLLEPNNPIAFSKKGHVDSFLGNYGQARQDFDNSAKVGGDAIAWFNSSANFKAFINLYNNKPQKALNELSQHLKSIDASSFSVAQKNQAKLSTLSNMSQIALYKNLLPQAKNYIKDRETLINNLITKVDDKQFSRMARADIHFFNGQLQLKQGKTTLALQSADKMSLLLESIDDVKKDEDVNQLKALISIKKEQWQQAVAFLDKANQDKLMVKFSKSMALEQIGKTKQAEKLLNEVKNYNFNNVEFALLRNDATAKLDSMSIAMID